MDAEKVVRSFKEFYFKEVPWSPTLSRKTTAMLTKLTRAATPFFPGLDAAGVMNELSKFSKQDMDDIFLNDQDGAKFIVEDKLCDNLDQPKKIGVIYGNE